MSICRKSQPASEPVQPRTSTQPARLPILSDADALPLPLLQAPPPGCWARSAPRDACLAWPPASTSPHPTVQPAPHPPPPCSWGGVPKPGASGIFLYRHGFASRCCAVFSQYWEGVFQPHRKRAFTPGLQWQFRGKLPTLNGMIVDAGESLVVSRFRSCDTEDPPTLYVAWNPLKGELADDGGARSLGTHPGPTCGFAEVGSLLAVEFAIQTAWGGGLPVRRRGLACTWFSHTIWLACWLAGEATPQNWQLTPESQWRSRGTMVYFTGRVGCRSRGRARWRSCP